MASSSHAAGLPIQKFSKIAVDNLHTKIFVTAILSFFDINNRDAYQAAVRTIEKFKYLASSSFSNSDKKEND